MIRKYLLLIIAVFSLSAAQGAEKSSKYALQIGNFNKIRIDDNVNVVYNNKPDSTGYAMFFGRPEFADSFIFTNNGKGTLRVQVNTDDVNSPDLPTLYIYSDYLTSVVSSSEKTVEIHAPAPAPEFSARLVGNGRIIADNLNCTVVKGELSTGCGTVLLHGKADKAVLKMVGTGVIQADKLRANRVDCTILGSGQIGCWAVDFLTVKGIGSTKIYYRGNPRIKKTGGGKLISIPGASEPDAGE